MTTPTIPPVPAAASAQRASTARHFAVSVSVNGASLGAFTTMGGGRTTAESSKHTVNGTKRVALGGARDTDDVTVGRPFLRARDHELARQLRRLVGSAEVVISRQPLDADSRPFGRPELYTGVLRDVGYPDVDEESSDVAMLELVVTVDGDVG